MRKVVEVLEKQEEQLIAAARIDLPSRGKAASVARDALMEAAAIVGDCAREIEKPTRLERA